jgi:hypothetical protein
MSFDIGIGASVCLSPVFSVLATGFGKKFFCGDEASFASLSRLQSSDNFSMPEIDKAMNNKSNKYWKVIRDRYLITS